MALSKNKIKYIQSLKEKKYRIEHRTFVAEGAKLVFDLLESMLCQFLAAEPGLLKSVSSNIDAEKIEATEDELKKASFLKSTPQIIAVFYQPPDDISSIDFSKGLYLVLDGVQDPGNLGTIVRLADWFGIEHVFCSPDTADIYNPKTVQATMGAIARVKVHYTDIAELLAAHSNIPIYGTFLNGNNVYGENLSDNGFIVMGSEGNGVSAKVEKLINNRLFIPNYPTGQKTSESLNVAAATAIVCSEFRRR